MLFRFDSLQQCARLLVSAADGERDVVIKCIIVWGCELATFDDGSKLKKQKQVRSSCQLAMAHWRTIAN